MEGERFISERVLTGFRDAYTLTGVLIITPPLKDFWRLDFEQKFSLLLLLYFFLDKIFFCFYYFTFFGPNLGSSEDVFYTKFPFPP